MANKYTDFQNGLAMALAAGAASGGAGVTEITKAEYDALSEEEKNNGKLYLINDYAEGGIVSSDVSGMESTVLWEGNVSSAIDVSLTDSIKNYDILAIRAGQDDTFCWYYVMPKYIIYNTMTDIEENGVISGSNRYVRYVFIDNKTVHVIGIGEARTCLTKIIGLKFKAKVYKPENEYSLEEKRIGTWIDGKPLYQKVLSGLDISWSGDRVWRTISPDISDLHIENLVSCVGLTSGRPLYFNFTKIDNNVIQAYVMAGWSIQTLILQYTKTTD